MEKFMVNLKYMKAPTKASPAPVVSTTFTLSVAALGTGQCITFLSELVVKVKLWWGFHICQTKVVWMLFGAFMVWINDKIVDNFS